MGGPLCRVRLDNTRGGSPRPSTTGGCLRGSRTCARRGHLRRGVPDAGPDRGRWNAPSTWAAAPMRLSIASPPTMATTRCTTCCWWRRRGWLLLAFASCQRFGGEFRLHPDGRLEIVMNTEGRTLAPGAHWQSEALICLEGRTGGPARDAGAAYRRRARLLVGRCPRARAAGAPGITTTRT